MASTGAVLYIKPRSVAAVKPGRHTGGVIYIAARFLTGLYSEPGITASANLSGLKAWLPPAHVPVVKQDGLMAEQWYRFFNYLANTKLGGPNSSTLPDIATTVVTASERAAVVEVVTAGLTQQTAQNAEALATTVEVVQNNSLTGASAIPPVQRTSGMLP